MSYFRAVRSGGEISISVADFLEQVAPKQYHGANRTKTICMVNDTLHGRSDVTITMLYELLEQVRDVHNTAQLDKIKQDIEAFHRQKLCRTLRYTRTGQQEYRYDMYDFDPQCPLKIISQPLFDHAAEHGFPPDFFAESYFDHVRIYCMPDNVDCSYSRFQNCCFSVCGIRGAVFDNADLDNTDFRSSLLQMVNFTGTRIANSHFRDCDMVSVSFQDARLKSCLMLDCVMDRIDFLGATLNGSDFGRIKASRIFNLSNATITEGGATSEEVKCLQQSIFQALRPFPSSVVRRSKSRHKAARSTIAR